MRLCFLEFGFLIMTFPQKTIYGGDGGELLEIRKKSR